MGTLRTVEVSMMRPRRVGEILDAAIKIYVSQARTLIGVAAVTVLPLQVLSGILLLSTIPSGSDIPSSTVNFSSRPRPAADSAAALGASGINLVVQLIATALVTAACVKAVSDAYMDHPTSIGRSLRFALRRLPAVLATEILYFIGLVAAFICLIIPGIWLYASWSVAIPALIIERRGPVRALGRSRRLVKGRWWPTAGVLIVAEVMAVVVGGIIQAILAAIESVPSQPSLLLAVVTLTLSAFVSAALVQPFTAAVNTVLYYDLRVRHEGYDLHVLADQLGLPGPGPATGADGDDDRAGAGGWTGGAALPLGPESVGQPGGPPYWPPPPGWKPGL